MVGKLSDVLYYIMLQRIYAAHSDLRYRAKKISIFNNRENASATMVYDTQVYCI